MKKIMFLVFGVILIFVMSCFHNDYDDIRKNVENIELSYYVSNVNDTLNGFCFLPIDINVVFNNGGKKYVDSVLLRKSGMESFVKFDDSYKMSVVYDMEGDYEIVIRSYKMHDGGKFVDTIINIRVGVGYSGVSVDAVLGDSGSFIVLGAVGYKAEAVEWEWDLRRVGGSVLRCSKDTAIFWSKVCDDTVFVSQVDSLSRKSTSVPVVFKARLGLFDGISYYVSLFSNKEYDTYCFYPVTFRAILDESVLRTLEKIELFVMGNSDEQPIVLDGQNNYTTVFSYVDTGSYNCVMRVYENVDGNIVERDKKFIIRVGINYGGEAVVGVLSSKKLDVYLKVIGDIANDVMWEWDLRSVGQGMVVTKDRILNVVMDSVFNTVVYVNQVDSLGRRSISVSVPFEIKHKSVDDVPYTISRNKEGYHGYCFEPITFKALPRGLDVENIDSIILDYNDKDLGRMLVKLDKDFSTVIDFADTGVHKGTMNVYSFGETLSQSKNFEVWVGANFYLDDYLVAVDSFGVSLVSLRANGYLPVGGYWRWTLPNGNVYINSRDTLVETRFDLGAVEEIRNNNVILEQIKSGRVSTPVKSSLEYRLGLEVTVYYPFVERFGVNNDKLPIDDVQDFSGYKINGIGNYILDVVPVGLTDFYFDNSWYGGGDPQEVFSTIAFQAPVGFDVRSVKCFYNNGIEAKDLRLLSQTFALGSTKVNYIYELPLLCRRGSGSESYIVYYDYKNYMSKVEIVFSDGISLDDFLVLNLNYERNKNTNISCGRDDNCYSRMQAVLVNVLGLEYLSQWNSVRKSWYNVYID